MDRNATRRKKYAKMPPSKKMGLLQRRKENRAAKKKNAHLLPRIRKVPLGYMESGVSFPDSHHEKLDGANHSSMHSEKLGCEALKRGHGSADVITEALQYMSSRDFAPFVPHVHSAHSSETANDMPIASILAGDCFNRSDSVVQALKFNKEDLLTNNPFENPVEYCSSAHVSVNSEELYPLTTTSETGKDPLLAPELFENVVEYSSLPKVHMKSGQLQSLFTDISIVAPSMPYDLKRLFIENDEESAHFRNNVRTYNNNLGFTSFAAKYDLELIKNTKGVYTFRVQEELAKRIESSDKLRESTLRLLMHILSNNPYAKFFKNLRHVPNIDTYKIVLNCHPGLDKRVYNLPTASQVVAIWTEDDDESADRNIHIQVYTHSNASHRIEHYYGFDSYVKIENSRLDFHRHRQNVVRSEILQEVLDSVSLGQTEGSKVGRRIVLPASFIGGPRDIRRRYFDAMTLPQFKLLNPESYDKVVGAKLPDRLLYPHLYSLVIKHMIHGSCGEMDKSCPCMKDGSYKNHYPKSLCPHTTYGEDSYPYYRRWGDGKKVKVRRFTLDNKCIVPYNPYLLTLFDCHMNVKICSTIKRVKYLYKYVFKGHDLVSFRIMTDDSATGTDEIKEFQKGSPSKSAACFFSENSNLLQLLAKVDFSKTMLTEFFKMNATNATAENLKCFIKISLSISFGLPSINTERKGSVEREAALALELLQSDTYIEETLEKAAAFQMPSSLRLLFATLLVYCSPIDPTMLWKKFELDFSRDYLWHKQSHDHSLAEIRGLVLADINKSL
ncbi:uncharacterized protein [Coffea arabica]|uniref:Helitron helicase-like domain-containing protein n=1 Tax=Coffea arabica TaxID=13443 RepID=A0ABM4VHB4_COFAR